MDAPMTAVRHRLAQRGAQVATLCLLLATGLVVAAHMVNDRLVPAGADRSFDLSLPYLEIVVGAVILLAGTLAVFALPPSPWRVIAMRVGWLGLVAAGGWFALAALGDCPGFGTRACAPGEQIGIYSTTACVPSPLADRIQLPLHLTVVALLFAVLILTVNSLSAAQRRERAERESPETGYVWLNGRWIQYYEIRNAQGVGENERGRPIFR